MILLKMAFYNCIQMKRHERQISLQLKLGKSSSQDIHHHKTESLSRPFLKKTEQQQFAPTINIIRNLSRKKRTQAKLATYLKDSPSRSLQKKISMRTTNDNYIERQSMNIHAYVQPTVLTTKTKLIRINNIFNRKVQGDIKRMLQKVYENHKSYKGLVKQWQSQQIYDDVDKQIYCLTQTYIQSIQAIISKNITEMTTKLQRYEQVMVNLLKQNERLKQIQRKYRDIADLVIPLKMKLSQQETKLQWHTYFINQIGKNIDVQTFIHSCNFYKYWVHGEMQNRGLLLRKKIKNKLQRDTTERERRWTETEREDIVKEHMINLSGGIELTSNLRDESFLKN